MKINSKVVSDRFEDECVVVNLETGFYYSVRGAAAIIWTGIEDGLDVRAIKSGFQELSTDQENEVDQFLEKLVAEGLASKTEQATDKVFEGEKVVFESPELSRFEDMSDLIMIDPIHDSDQEKGWPHEADQ